MFLSGNFVVSKVPRMCLGFMLKPPPVLLSQLRSFSPVIEKSVNQLIAQLNSNHECRVDLLQFYRRLTFNVIGHVGFGVGFDSVDGEMPKVSHWPAVKRAKYGNLLLTSACLTAGV